MTWQERAAAVLRDIVAREYVTIDAHVDVECQLCGATGDFGDYRVELPHADDCPRLRAIELLKEIE